MFYRAVSELKAESARYYASFLWWLLEPMIYMGAFYMVFGIIFQRGGPDYVPFLLCGLISWKWFVSTVNNGAAAITASSGLIRQVYVKKFVFPGSVVVSNTFRFAFVFAIFIVLLLCFGNYPHPTWLALPLVLITQLFFNTAVCFFLAAVVPFVPDLRQVIEKLLLLGFFVSGIFFDINAAPDAIRPFFIFNPMAVIIRDYRIICLNHQWPFWQGMLLITIGSVFLFCIALMFLSRFDRQYAKVLV